MNLPSQDEVLAEDQIPELEDLQDSAIPLKTVINEIISNSGRVDTSGAGGPGEDSSDSDNEDVVDGFQESGHPAIVDEGNGESSSGFGRGKRRRKATFTLRWDTTTRIRATVVPNGVGTMSAMMIDMGIPM